MILLQTELMRLLLHVPGDGFYRGTRFDASGVFDSVLFKGLELCGRWFTAYDPFMHDAVCGPAEEFSPVGYDQAAPGGTFLKIGVGLLKRPSADAYDRFHLYEVADPGVWDVSAKECTVRYRHILDGWYDYIKVITLDGDSGITISHELTPRIALDAEVYNHNFFTLGRMEVGPSRHLDFPFTPAGDWRAQYDSVAFTGSGVRFSRQIQPGESVYTGNIHTAGGSGMPYSMSLREGSACVRISGDAPVTRTVLWANHRIACLEPYNSLQAVSGQILRWTIKYSFEL